MTTKQYLVAYKKAQTEVNRLWILMCRKDGVNPNAKFVVFANENPYAPEYNDAVAAFQTIRKQIRRVGR